MIVTFQPSEYLTGPRSPEWPELTDRLMVSLGYSWPHLAWDEPGYLVGRVENLITITERGVVRKPRTTFFRLEESRLYVAAVDASPAMDGTLLVAGHPRPDPSIATIYTASELEHLLLWQAVGDDVPRDISVETARESDDEADQDHHAHHMMQVRTVGERVGPVV